MIYHHGRTFFDTVTLQVSVDIPLESTEEKPDSSPCDSPAIQAVVTRKCNLSCSYCNVRLSDDSVDSEPMSFHTAEKVVNLASEADSGRLVMVTGGEPLLVPQVTFHILERVAAPKVLFTNATLVTDEIALRIRQSAVSPVVSLDGMLLSHDIQRNGSWKRVAKGLDILRNNGVAYGLSAVVNRTNMNTVAGDMNKVWERFKPSGMGFNIVHWTSTGFNPPTDEEYAAVMENVFRTALSNGIFVDQIARRLDPLITGRYRHRDCSAMGGKLVIHPDGSQSNCISGRSVEDWSERTPEFMSQCQGCHAAGVCGGGCAWDGIHLGENGGPDLRHCLWVKRVLNLILEDIGKHFPAGPVTRDKLYNRYKALVSRGHAPLKGSIGHGG